ncbi:hypothetical protein DYB38_008793 [Aphanomyces astaci]|uniref:Major facilitator superfamily (MFS) profile domain-containing protein n=1 Tax=Aphanomyces astaci TaxID=112090 RepID=A0A397DSV2_APHAT|nr:hypothetical protein DYB38_008793 [Aphanomyces astaci]
MVSKKQCCLTAAVFAGMLVGGLVGGVMADAYGRRPIVLLNLGINAVSALLSALSPSLNWLILFRCLAGIGVGGIVSCLFALCVEHLPTSARARYITILCSFWMVVRCISFGVVSTNAFPLPVRVTAMSVVSSMGRLGAIAAQFVNGFLIGPPSHLMTLLVVTASVLLIGAAAVGGVTPASTTSLPRKPKTASGRILRDTDDTDSTNLSSVVVRSSHMNVQDE